MKRFGTGVLSSLLVLAMSCGCGGRGGSTQNEEQKTPHVARIALGGAVSTLNPYMAYDVPAIHVTRMLFEGLMRLGPQGEIINGLADRYEQSEDGLRWTFHLRDAQWSNGDPITAYDFEYSWQRAVAPETARATAGKFVIFKHADACMKQELPIASLGVKALDTKRLQVDLEQPIPYLLALLSTTPFYPMNKRVDLENPNWHYKAGAGFVTSGPFRLTRWQKGDRIEVRKSETYWNACHVRLDRVDLRVVADQMTQVHLFENGEIDWLGRPFARLSLDFAQSETAKKYDLKNQDKMGISAIFVNTRKEPFSNKFFRKALSTAIDRERIVRDVIGCNFAAARALLNSVIAVTDQPYFLDADPELARLYLEKALEELGMTRDELSPVVLSYRSTATAVERSMMVIQEAWREVLGLDVRMEKYTHKTQLANLFAGRFDVCEMGWVSWLTDPTYMLSCFVRDEGTNGTGWFNQEYVDCFYASEGERDPSKRLELFRRCEEILMDEFPIIPIYEDRNIYLCSSRLKGLELDPCSNVDLSHAYIVEE